MLARLSALWFVVGWYMGTASVLRPSQSPELLINFDAVAPAGCDIDDAAVVFDEYTSSSARFSGPGYGRMNGGAALNACTFSSGAFPPLGNESFDGSGVLGFSTLHVLAGGAKPIGPETIRFDVRVTNIALEFAGIDDKQVRCGCVTPPHLIPPPHAQPCVHPHLPS